jgi:hypothetical protein
MWIPCMLNRMITLLRIVEALRSDMRRIRWFWFFIILLSIAPAAQATSFAQHTTQSEYHRYIIRLAGQPLALAAESLGAISGQNGKLLTQQTSLQNYKTALHRNRQASLRQIHQTLGRQPQVISTYDTAFHGLILELSHDEAQRISNLPGILNIQQSQHYQLASNLGPELIGATKIHSGESSGIYAATLLGSNMSPALNSNLTGRARLAFDSGSQQLRVNITLNNAGSTSAQLIRTSDKSVVATWQPTSATSYAATITLNATDQALLRANGLFLRITTTTHPNG